MITAFLGRNTVFLVGGDGKCWATGENKVGQVGVGKRSELVEGWERIVIMGEDGDEERKEVEIVGGSAGVGFSILLSKEGKGEHADEGERKLEGLS